MVKKKPSSLFCVDCGARRVAVQDSFDELTGEPKWALEMCSCAYAHIAKTLTAAGAIFLLALLLCGK